MSFSSMYRSRKRSRSEKPEDKYKDEKEYWMVEKALKFAQNQQKDKKEVVEELGIDRSNMLLFPTIASCTSSDDSQREQEQEQVAQAANDKEVPLEGSTEEKASRHHSHSHHHHRRRHHHPHHHYHRHSPSPQLIVCYKQTMSRSPLHPYE